MERYLTMEISASAVRANLVLLRRQLARGTRLCGVVKADCYGHGLGQLLDVIAAESDCLAVATPEEAIDVRDGGYEGPILAFFSPLALPAGRDEALAELIAKAVTITVVNRREVSAIAEAALRRGPEAHVHVKVDTGMTRAGVTDADAPELVDLVRRTAGVKLTGVYTHFACADEADKTSAREQLDRFCGVIARCGDVAGVTVHAANSAALIDMPQAHLDMVRPGIAMYGYQPSDEMRTQLPLRPALRMVGRVLQVRDVGEGTRCGYGLTGRFERGGRMARVAIGYGDGYPRCLSNRAVMGVGGGYAPVRGRVSMDQVILDVTDVGEVRPGGEVEIVSPDPSAPNSVANLARLAGTIPYEITCNLGRRARRVAVS